MKLKSARPAATSKSKARKRKAPRRQRATPTQKHILSFIITYKADPHNDGNSPTYEEIAEALGFHKANVYRHCRKLEERGWLQINEQGKLTIPGGRWRYLPPRK